MAVLAAVVIWRHGKTTQVAGPPMVPVTVATASQRDVPIYYDALGTVQAYNTVAIRAQVTGQLISVDFRQGQEVRQGDVLAKIDPAPLQAVLDQAVAKKADDQAQLVSAQKDFSRFTTLATKNFETQQNVDLQQAKVDHFKASIDADQGAIEAAQTQLAYTTIVAPIDGVVGFRQVDVGNIIHTTDVNPLTVLTQIKPSYVIFTLPQSNLGPVREAMLHGAVSVLAFDQNDKEQLAEGHLLLIDNQIDQNTSSIRLKAEFANADERLWPGEFVRIRILITTYKDAVTVPPVAVQRGPDGFYVWVVKPDNTAEQRPIGAQMVNDDTAIATKGLAAGERVVSNGQSRLDVGSHVAIKTANPPPGEPPSVQHQADKN
ncbi:MAG TPA: efflux RND transporter periplasmic adaptor subunit [Xanthobacteraceae bacterium]|nr:efflux RND transporter periplasmic adaptor subunit [Xanthobacteraceae bacterium]